MRLTPFGLSLLAVAAALAIAVLWGVRRTQLGRPRLRGTVIAGALLATIWVASGWAGFPTTTATRILPLLVGLSFWVVNEDLFEASVLLQTIALVVAVAGIIGVLFGQPWYGLAALAGSGVLIYLAERLRLTTSG